MSNATLSFVAWVRQGVASAITAEDSPGTSAAVTVSPKLVLNSQILPEVPIRLRGPADVLGIDPNQVVRTDPRPGAIDFESNCFAAIEFDRPDFPWLFTPARANASRRLRPWLCLVVVARQAGVTLDTPAGAPLPVLRIADPARPGVELPDLDDAWAWAHAQIAGDDSTEPELRKALGGGPELSLSRLICPRILAPETDYLACVVPTFEPGRLAGLGQPTPDGDALAPLKPAWSSGDQAPADLRLPVYFHWEFRTGEGGDFEAIAKGLRPGAPAGLGRRTIDISHPGFSAGGAKTISLEGALKPIAASGVAAPPPETPPETLPATFQTNLAAIVNAGGKVASGSGDPVLAPPIYGRWHAGRTEVSTTGSAWLDQLNLDPRWRVTAGFGTRVVQAHQEALMASAWEQAADLLLANQRLRQLQVSRSVGESLHGRHFAKFSDEAMLRVAAPALGRIGLSEGRSMLAQQAASRLPMGANGAAMRRIGRARGPLTRRLAAQGVNRAATPTWVGSLMGAPAAAPVDPTGSAAAAPVNSFGGSTSLFFGQPLFGQTQYSTMGGPSQSSTMAWLNNLTTSIAAYHPPSGPPAPPPPAFSTFAAPPTQELATSTSYFGAFFVAAETAPLTFPGEPVPVSPHTEVPGFFREAAKKHQAAFFPARPPEPHVAPAAELKGISGQALEQTRPVETLRALADAAIATGGNVLAATPPGIAPKGLETIMAAPRFASPMYEPLRDLSQDLLMPGLETVDRETVLGLQTNRPFVEAYLVGLNHEMGRELLWRGFPTDQRGTYFAQFWSRPGSDATDIDELNNWVDRPLGASPGGSANEAFVMLLRSRLLARYPNAVIYMTPARKTGAPEVVVPDPDPAKEAMPRFGGGMQPDVRFFGFGVTTAAATGTDGNPGYYVVIQEHPTEPRFGIDFGAAPDGVSHLAVGGSLPKGTTAWGENAAQIAAAFRRRPSRVAIHATRLIAQA